MADLHYIESIAAVINPEEDPNLIDEYPGLVKTYKWRAPVSRVIEKNVWGFITFRKSTKKTAVSNSEFLHGFDSLNRV